MYTASPIDVHFQSIYFDLHTNTRKCLAELRTHTFTTSALGANGYGLRSYNMDRLIRSPSPYYRYNRLKFLLIGGVAPSLKSRKLGLPNLKSRGLDWFLGHHPRTIGTIALSFYSLEELPRVLSREDATARNLKSRGVDYPKFKVGGLDCPKFKVERL